MYERAAHNLATMLEEESAKLNRQFGFELSKSISVYVCQTQEIFDQLTGHTVPDWGEGVADASRNAIILKSSSLFEKRRRLSKLVRHELIHILIAQMVGFPKPIPRWFNEGLACYFSYDEEFSAGKAISKAMLSGSVLSTEEIDDVLQFQTAKARLAYEQSFALVKFMEEEFGNLAAVDVVRQLAKGATFDNAFVGITGEELAEFELRWLNHIEQKYRWRFLLDFETFVWIFMVLLFIFVFVAIKIKNRRTMKRWDKEEGLTNL